MKSSQSNEEPTMAETLTSIVETMYREDPNREEEEVVDAVCVYAASLFSKRDTANFLREGIYKMLWDIRRSVKNQIRMEAAERSSKSPISEVFLNEAGEPMPTLQGTSLEGVTQKDWRTQIIDFAFYDVLGVSYKVTWGEASAEQHHKIANYYLKFSKTYAAKAHQHQKAAQLIQDGGKSCLNDLESGVLAA